jgi:hypothetical protein
MMETANQPLGPSSAKTPAGTATIRAHSLCCVLPHAALLRCDLCALCGDAKNSQGIPYRKLGLPLDCAIHVAGKLGTIAKPLERYLSAALRDGNPYAAAAMSQLGGLAAESIQVLADSLDSTSIDLRLEAAVTLLDGGYLGSPEVQEAMARAERAQRAVADAKRFRSSKNE